VREIRPPKVEGRERPPSVREQLTVALQRFERGEKAPPRPVLKGGTGGSHRSERGIDELMKGSILDK